MNHCRLRSPKALQQWLQMTYKKEAEHFQYKKRIALTQMEEAKEAVSFFEFISVSSFDNFTVLTVIFHLSKHSALTLILIFSNDISTPFMVLFTPYMVLFTLSFCVYSSLYVVFRFLNNCFCLD